MKMLMEADEAKEVCQNHSMCKDSSLYQPQRENEVILCV